MQRESILPNRDEPVFPIANRNTPLLDKINERRNNNNTLAHKLGERAGELIENTNEEERQEVLEKSRQDFKEALSNKLGVPEEAIKDSAVEEITTVFGDVDRSDIINEDLLSAVTEDGSEDEEDSPF